LKTFNPAKNGWALFRKCAYFEAMMMCKDCRKDIFVSFDYSSDALSEIESFFKRSNKVIVGLTVKEILDGQNAKKLV